MYCGNCGSDIPDGSKFCPKCGEKFISYGRPDAQAAGGGPGEVFRKKMSSRTIGIIAAAAVVVVAAVVLIIVLSNARTGINLNKYLTISESGYSGYGTATYDIDTWKLRQDYAGKIKLTSEGKNNYYVSMTVSQGEDPIDLIIDDLYGRLNQSENLSNGDKVIFSWGMDDVDTVETYLNVRLNTSAYEYVVSGLEDTTKEDIFIGISINYGGTAPNGTAAVNIDSGQNPWLSQNNVSLSKYEELSNGDVITATVSESGLSDLLNMYGIEPLETKKEFTVEGLPEYISSISQIPAEAIEKMQEPVTAELESHCEEHETLLSADYLGAYLMSYSSSINRVYLVYSVSVNETYEEDSQDVTFYWCAGYDSGMVLSDGGFTIDYADPLFPAYTASTGLFTTNYSGDYVKFSMGDHSFIYPGFEDLSSLKTSIGAYTPLLLDSTVQE